MVCSYLFIHCDSLCLVSGVFSTFTWTVIVDMFEFKSFVLVVWFLFILSSVCFSLPSFLVEGKFSIFSSISFYLLIFFSFYAFCVVLVILEITTSLIYHSLLSKSILLHEQCKNLTVNVHLQFSFVLLFYRKPYFTLLFFLFQTIYSL